MIEGCSTGDTVAREAMTPRSDVETVPMSTSIGDLRSIAARGTYIRYPVDDDGERPVGFVHVKDVPGATGPDADREGVTAGDLVSEVLAVPEIRRIDEWGAFEGVVTIEDVLEEISAASATSSTPPRASRRSSGGPTERTSSTAGFPSAR